MRMTTRGKTMKNLKSLTKKAKTVKVTKTVKVPKMKDTQKAGVLAVVRRLLAKNIENKVIGNAVEYNTVHNSSITAADCRPLIPEIPPIDSAAGSTAQQRIGDKIKPKRLKVSGVTSFSGVGLGQKDIYVRVLILAQKDIKTGGSVLANNVDVAHLLRPAIDPLNPQAAFGGYTMDLTYAVNTDKFRVYMDKVFKLHQCAESGVESIGKYSTRWSYTFKEGSLPASLTFDSGNGDWANNFAPFTCLGYAFSDGTAPDTVSTRVISNIYTHFEFEDA